MSGGGVGSVITDLCEATARDCREVYVINLYRKSDEDIVKESEWAKKYGVHILLMQEDPKMGVLGIFKRKKR